MDSYHPERATRLSAVQRKYRDIFGGEILEASNSIELRDALFCLADDDHFRAALTEGHPGDLYAMDNVLGGVRYAIRKSIAKININDMSYSAVKKAGLGLVFMPARLAMASVIPNGQSLARSPDGGPYEGFIEYATHVWDRAGRKIYSVAPGLRWKLENTELRGVRSRDFQLPYQCVYVGLSGRHRVAPSYHIDPDFGVEPPEGAPAEGVYVVEDHVDGLRVVHLVVVSMGGEGGTMRSGMLRSGQDLEDCIGIPWCLTLKFPEGSMVKDSVNELVRLVEDEARSMLSPERLEQVIRGARSIFNYILNIIMYATTPGVDACVAHCDPGYKVLLDRAMKAKKGSKKRKGLLDRAKSRSSQKMTVLGGNLYVNKGRESGGFGNGTGSKVTVRTLAAGHWRRVAHGEGRKQRRMTWIEPYWRGPEMGVVSRKKHVLTDGSSRGQS